MITYRMALKADAEKIKEYCLDRGINPPDSELLYMFVCEDEEKKIRGVVGVKEITLIEPLISDTPHISITLAEKAFAVLNILNKNVVTALVKGENESFVSLLEHYGFEITDKDMIILKRGI